MFNWLKRLAGSEQGVGRSSVDNGGFTLSQDIGELRLMLIRPSLGDIFGSSVPDGIPLVSEVEMPFGATMLSSLGFVSVSDATEDMFTPVAVLCVDSLGHVGYVGTIRIDIRLVVGSLAEQLSVPLGEFFDDRDALLFTRGWFRPMLSYLDASIASSRMNAAIDRGLRQQVLPKICYAMTWVDTGDRENLRRMEATASHLLTALSDSDFGAGHTPEEMPSLGNDWVDAVLQPLFTQVGSKLSGERTG